MTTEAATNVIMKMWKTPEKMLAALKGVLYQ